MRSRDFGAERLAVGISSSLGGGKRLSFSKSYASSVLSGESIVKGTNILDSGMPESFSVLIHELRGLGLDTQLLGGENEGKRRKAEASAAAATESVEPAAADDLLAGVLSL